jgi:2',3'-cyclic-nucleotide 2'-phosphodiesterase (5'-nucleotidase family)
VEKNGYRIGIFGLLGEEAAANAPMSAPAVFEDIRDAAKRVVAVLKDQEKADLIVCLSHSGTKEDISESEDEQLAKAVPDIDVIVSGHTHTILKQPIVVAIPSSCRAVRTAHISRAGYAMEADAWRCKAIRCARSTLPPADAAEVQKSRFKRGENTLRTTAYSMTRLSRIPPTCYEYQRLSTPPRLRAGDLSADAYMYAIRQAEGDAYETVDVAVVPVGIIRATINQGSVPVADAFKILSLGTGPDGLTGYPLISVYLYGWELINVCEVDASVSAIMGDAQLFFSGMEYTYNPNSLIFNKTLEVKLVRTDGTSEAIEKDKLYRVACSLYSGQMLAYVKEKSFGILSITPKDEAGAEITDYNSRIICTQDGMELKEWQSVVSYLASFDEQNGVSTIPEVYAAPQGRKIADTSGGIFGALGHPNTVAWIVYAIVVVLLAAIVLTVVGIVKGAKKRRARRAEKAQEKAQA